MQTFRAYRVHKQEGKVRGGLETLTQDDLSPGEVVIHSAWSSVNFKDALAGTGEGKIMRRFPLIGGIDVSGYVAESSHARFRAGDPVLVTGYGLSQDHDGGYAEVVRVPADWVVPLPDGLSLYQAMAIGTAGFTAALALERMEQMGQEPAMGPILVTGATGGVGSFAVELFSSRGYEVAAVTGKQEQAGFLRFLGAADVIDRHTLDLGERPLEHARWGGAVDNVGGEMLAGITRTVSPWGSIASIGLAGGVELHATVMPFIIRGVNLLGINSAGCGMPLRSRIWGRLASDLLPLHLDRIVTETATLDELPSVFRRMLDGKTTGRTVVRLAGESK